MRALPRLYALAVASLLAACGAKTGLLVPDATAVADAADDAFVRFEACVAGRFTMVRREAQVVLVIDRSGSMVQRLVDGDPASRWEAMQTALAETLPPFEDVMRMGVLLYPRVPASGALANQQRCDQLPGDGVDIPPARGNARSVLDAIRAQGPGGATPTAAAVARAAQYTLATGSRELARYLVLATDGGPNCNGSLDPSTCVCSAAGSNCADLALGSRFCLDEEGTVAALDDARRRGVATYVLGIDGDLPEVFVRALDRMAVAGGRPLPAGGRRYFSIGDRAQLSAAFEGIQRTVVRCAYVTPSRPDDPDRITVQAGGVDVPRDPRRQNGWDWTDRDYGELTLFGPACERVIGSAAPLEATVACGR